MSYNSRKSYPRAPKVPRDAAESHETAPSATRATTETPSVARPAESRPPPLYENETWVVTEDGMQSKYVLPSGHTLDYVVPKEQLLELRAEGVSAWALQLAGKSWLNNIDQFLDALEAALRAHHRHQEVIDVEETRRRAREAWDATRAIATRDPPTLPPLEDAPDCITSSDPTEPAWIAAELQRTRMLLLRYGVPPDSHPKAAAFNITVVGALHGLLGFCGAALDEEVESLRKRVFGQGSQSASDDEPKDPAPRDDVG